MGDGLCPQGSLRATLLLVSEAQVDWRDLRFHTPSMNLISLLGREL